MKRSFFSPIFALVFALVLSACGSDPVEDTSGGGGGGGGTSKAWTLMVYIAGDNNLSEFALADLQELKNAGQNSNVNVVVQMEYNSTYASSSTYSGNNTYRGAVTGASTSLSAIGNQNMSSKTTLTNFVTWAKTNYPASQYGLVLWSHGGGWKANKGYRGNYRTARGALADDSVGGFMSLKDIKDGIAGAMGTTKLDMLAFDACLMAHYEVAYELRNTAKYLVASEELVPGPGMPYTAVVNALVASPSQTPVAFGTAMAAAFNASYSASEDTTMSVTDLSQMDTLHAAVLDLSSALVAVPESGVVTSAKAGANGYGGTGANLFAIDFYKFADYIANNAVNTTTKAAAAAVRSAITAAVGTRFYNTGGGSGSKGMGIYMPQAAASELGTYQSSATSNTAVSGKSTWKDFLASYYGGSAGSAVKVAGNFAYYITWDNANADVDLVINEPLGNWAAAWIGSTSPNGFLSSDSAYSGQQFESYTAAPMVDGGNTYDVFVHLYGCKNGLTTCPTTVKVYKKDGANASFAQVAGPGTGGGYFVCVNCPTNGTTIGTYPYNTTDPYGTTTTTGTILYNMWHSSDWYPILSANVTRNSPTTTAKTVIQPKSLKADGHVAR